MEIAGIKIPERLEFGNEEHIKIREQVERRLKLLNEGIECGFCGHAIIPCRVRVAGDEYAVHQLKWSCDYCCNEFRTDLDGSGL